jgi:hypothetical protein
MLGTDREIEGRGHNRVVGPDFQWRPSSKDVGHRPAPLLVVAHAGPPELADEWDGRALSGHDGQASWNHSTPRLDWYGQYTDASDGFRADTGFIPQVGYRDRLRGERPTPYRPTSGPMRRLRTYLIYQRTEERDGDLILRQYSPGFGLDGKWSSFVRIRYAFDKVARGSVVCRAGSCIYTIQVSPSQKVSRIELVGSVGQEADFDNARPGHGANIVLRTTLRPTDHLELQFNDSRRWLDVDVNEASSRSSRPRWTGCAPPTTSRARTFVRGIVQYVDTRRDRQPLRRRGGGQAGLVRRFGPLRLQAETGRPCSSWATGTTARSWRRPTGWSARTGSLPEAVVRVSSAETALVRPPRTRWTWAVVPFRIQPSAEAARSPTPPLPRRTSAPRTGPSGPWSPWPTT